jgi:hypothetical protein
VIWGSSQRAHAALLSIARFIVLNNQPHFIW